MAGPGHYIIAAVIACTGALLLASCGDGGKGAAEEALVSITLRLPEGPPEKTAALGDRLLQALEKGEAGEITAVKREGRLLELTVRIRELSAINRIKKAIIEIEPSSEYRIEHR